MMGGENLKKSVSMGAGNIVGIGGLDDILIKTGTISSVPYCPSFTKANMKGTGIIQVAVETTNIEDGPKLIEGLKKLDKADPSVSYFLNERGEYIISTCGQIHLERCQRDLEKTFAGVKLNFSDPIVLFKEALTFTKLISASYADEEEEKKEDSEGEGEDEESKQAKQVNKSKMEDVYVDHVLNL